VASNRPDINYDSPEWAKVEEWLDGELLETYQRLAGISNTEPETQRLRGMILWITKVLDLRNQEEPEKFIL
jgi:hypothetical protein